MLADSDLLRLLDILRSLDLDTLRLLGLNIIRLLDLSIIETVLIATKVIKGVVTVYKPNKTIIKVIVIEFSLVKVKIIAKIAKTTLKTVIKYSFIVLDLY